MDTNKEKSIAENIENESENQAEEQTTEEQLIQDEPLQEESSEGAIRLQEITLRLHEIDLLLDEYEDRPFEDNESIADDQEHDQILSLKREYRQLKKEMKLLYKTVEGKFWDKIPIWMFVYGIVQIILSSFLIMPWLTVYAFDAFAGAMTGMLQSNIGIFFLIFGVTFINLLITGVIFYFVFKDKLKRVVISVIWGLQFLSSITTFLTLWNTYINFINWS